MKNEGALILAIVVMALIAAVYFWVLFAKL
jgi:hypothetical protein